MSAVRQAMPDYLSAFGDPNHPEHENMRLWGPEQFDPNVVGRRALEAAVNALSGIKGLNRLARRHGSGSGNPMLAWPRPPR